MLQRSTVLKRGVRLLERGNNQKLWYDAIRMLAGLLSLSRRWMWIGVLAGVVVGSVFLMNMQESRLSGQLNVCYHAAPCGAGEYDMGGYCYADGTPCGTNGYGVCGAGSCMPRCTPGLPDCTMAIWRSPGQSCGEVIDCCSNNIDQQGTTTCYTGMSGCVSGVCSDWTTSGTTGTTGGATTGTTGGATTGTTGGATTGTTGGATTGTTGGATTGTTGGTGGSSAGNQSSGGNNQSSAGNQSSGGNVSSSGNQSSGGNNSSTGNSNGNSNGSCASIGGFGCDMRSLSSVSSSGQNCSNDAQCGGGLICSTGCRITGKGCTQLCRSNAAACVNGQCVYGNAQGGLDIETQCDQSACVVSSSATGCPAGTSCMEETVCFKAGGTMDWSNGVSATQAYCAAQAGNNWAGCCRTGSQSSGSNRSGSSRSGSATSEQWVFTDCPGNTEQDPILCVMGTPGQQTCPPDTLSAGTTCKNTKYENGVLVAQSVGICCQQTNRNSSSTSSVTTGLFCCLPLLNNSCLQVASQQVCADSQGYIAGSTLQGCQQACANGSQSSRAMSCTRDSDCPQPSCNINGCCPVVKCQNNVCTTTVSCTSSTGSNGSNGSNNSLAGSSSSAPCSSASVASTATTASQPKLRMRVTFTQATNTNPAFPAESRVYINGPTGQAPNRPLVSVASGEWFDVEDVATDGITADVRGPKLYLTEPLGITNNDPVVVIRFDPPLQPTRDTSYATFNGTIFVEGAEMKRIWCSPSVGSSVWYCPEKENDGVVLAPDNDEIRLQNNTVNFNIHTKNVINSEGRTDMFNMELHPTQIAVAAPKRPSFFASLLSLFSFFDEPTAQVASGYPRMRITFTRVESSNVEHPAEPLIHLDENTTVASGEWFDSGRLQPYAVINGFSIFGDGGGRVTANANWFPRDGGYFTYYGTLEVEGRQMTYQNCNGNNSMWYCPEGMHDGITAAPDNDEVWIDAGVLHFALHPKNVLNTEGSMDTFYIGYEAASSTSSLPSSASSLMPCSEGSVSSANSAVINSSNSNSNNSQNSNGSNGSNNSNGSNGSQGSNNSQNSNGSNGSQNSDGSNGSNGSQNSNGSNGSQGSTSSTIVGGNCSGNECTEIGNAYCVGLSKVCTQLTDLPCARCDDPTTGSSSNSQNTNSSSPIIIVDNSSAFNQPFIEQNSSAVAGVPLPTYSSSPVNSAGMVVMGLPPTALAFLGETCSVNAQCITNLCRSGLCVPCSSANDCSSNVCRNGACLNMSLMNNTACSENEQCISGLCLNGACAATSVLPESVIEQAIKFIDPVTGRVTLLDPITRLPLLDPVTGQPLLHAPTSVLPATVIELPFTDSMDTSPHARTFGGGIGGTLQATVAGQNASQGRTPGSYSSAPQTPSTGPAALAIMLAGGAAGWLYRRRK